MVRTGRGEDSVYVAIQHMKNHVWREVWPAMPAVGSVEAKQYWRLATHHVMSLFDGGGGGMKRAAELAGRAAGQAAAHASAAMGKSAAQQRKASEKASKKASKQTVEELRAATTHPCTKLHLYQVGEYQLQDAQLSEPFEVNLAFLLMAYVGLARGTGCRPGMAMNDGNDLTDTDSHWHELPPLQMGDLCIAMEELLGDAGETGGARVVTEGDFEALCRMEVTFKRKKGEYFACYEFGNALTPDSDQMIRIGTLAVLRLLLRCGSFRACYARLSEAGAKALRAKVADPGGFAGLAIEDTGYSSFLALARACREDGWVLDRAALDRPLFPAIDEATGLFLFTESFQVGRVCKRLIDTGAKIGMNKHKVGAWSLRKDACGSSRGGGGRRRGRGI